MLGWWLAIRNDRLDANPELAADLFDVFARAKAIYIDRLKMGQVDPGSSTDQVFRRVMEIAGDPLPYGIEPNRLALESIVQYSVEQGILPRTVPIEELFPPTTRTLTA